MPAGFITMHQGITVTLQMGLKEMGFELRSRRWVFESADTWLDPLEPTNHAPEIQFKDSGSWRLKAMLSAG